ncbi:DUF5667 domain-containing protein [Nocardioides sp.]|uniref:DUF5667 domain-containing protein n=1 Tax=Nocardioides sp. TaxID=35761 RepID=UPI003515F6C1
MRPHISSRRAEEFNALLEGLEGSADGATASGEHAELLALVGALRAVPEPAARPDFVASLRTQLVAAAEREPTRAEAELAAKLTPRQRRGTRERRVAALVAGFAVVSATGSMAVASQGALPGDALYPVKRAIENAQTNLQRDDADKAATLLEHAQARLDELEQLTARDRDADQITATLQDFTDQIGEAGDLALDDYSATGSQAQIADLRDFTSDSMGVLGRLSPQVPASSRPILITATQTVKRVDTAAWEACPTCAAGAVIDLPDWALQRLSKVLSGDLPDLASLTRTGTAPLTGGPQPSDAPGRTPSAPGTSISPGRQGGASSSPSAPGVVPDLPTTSSPSGNVLNETVDKVTDTIKGITGGSKPTKPASSPSSSPTRGTLVGGISGAVDGLLGR